MSIELKRWDLWWAYVTYEDRLECEKRPVLIYNRETAYLLSFKITTHPPRKNYAGEYQIHEWEKAGLTKPSTIRCSKKVYLTELDIDEKIGELQAADIKEVRKILLEMYGLE